MSKKLVKKIAYYSVYETKTNNSLIYEIDNGKVIYSKKYKKYITNPYRDVQSFNNFNDAKNYIEKKLKSNNKIKKQIKPKSLYLVLIKEISTNLTFVKVGITAKKFINSRFSKSFGYDGYVIESILRRIDTPEAEELEDKIKTKIKNKRTIKKYRPLLESFSGYSECFDIKYLNDIVKIFDGFVKKL